MFGQIDHTVEIATCAYFFGFQRTDKVNRNCFSSAGQRLIFSTRITNRRQSACPACCTFLLRRAGLPRHAQKMCKKGDKGDRVIHRGLTCDF